MILQEKSLNGVVILSVNYDELIQTLKEISARIKDKFDFVLKIYLFGSFAKGKYTPESDLDILIVLSRCDLPFIERRDLFVDFFKEIPFDLNIFAYTEDEIGEMIAQKNLFITEVLEEAVEISK
jgi:predicted nucleotidyltransferase